jgi:toxin secretion/phage lysis holin
MAMVAGLSSFVGGFDKLVVFLLYCIAVDYSSGLISGVIQGTLNSRVGFKGILKKVLMLVAVSLAYQIDIVLGLPGLTKAAICCYLIANEGISIVENFDKCGLPLPNFITERFEQIKKEGV